MFGLRNIVDKNLPTLPMVCSHRHTREPLVCLHPSNSMGMCNPTLYCPVQEINTYSRWEIKTICIDNDGSSFVYSEQVPGSKKLSEVISYLLEKRTKDTVKNIIIDKLYVPERTQSYY